MTLFRLLQPWGLAALLAVSNLNAAERSAETLAPDQPSSALRGSLLRGLGVNVYDAFTRALEEPNARAKTRRQTDK